MEPFDFDGLEDIPNTSVTFMYTININVKEWFIIESHQITSFYPSADT